MSSDTARMSGRGSVGGCKRAAPILSHARQQVVGPGLQQGYGECHTETLLDTRLRPNRCRHEWRHGTQE
jgi:hypothetical protein